MSSSRAKGLTLLVQWAYFNDAFFSTIHRHSVTGTNRIHARKARKLHQLHRSVIRKTRGKCWGKSRPNQVSALC